MRSVSDLNPYWGRFLGFAPPCGIASFCTDHCITCAAQGIKGHADLASSPPSSPVRGQSRLTNITDNGGCVRYPTEGNSSSHELTTTMHHLPSTLEGFSRFWERAAWFLALVRFFAYRRIKPHDPPLVRVPVYSFEF